MFVMKSVLVSSMLIDAESSSVLDKDNDSFADTEFDECGEIEADSDSFEREVEL